MDAGLNERRGETAAHRRLKRLAALWAQARGYSACATEVSLPQCRYRADVAAHRPERAGVGSTIIFECKQALPDLRRDNCCTAIELERLGTIQKRREILEKYLRVHYPSLRNGDSLFPEFASHNFAAIGHRTYTRVLRELIALQNRLYGGTKFERLLQYRCANLFFLVLPNELFPRAGIAIWLGRFDRLRGRSEAFAQTTLARNHPGKSRSSPAPHRDGRHAKFESRIRNQL